MLDGVISTEAPGTIYTYKAYFRRLKILSDFLIVGQVSLSKFYGGGARDSGVEDSDNSDLATVVKRRRILAARAAEQRHVREREERSRSVVLDSLWSHCYTPNLD